MSIWATRAEIGWDDEGWVSVTGTRIEPTAAGGEVRSYADGFSNHYPTADDTVERRATIDTASIPSWCVPGNRTSDDDTAVGPWLRLGVASVRHTTTVEPAFAVADMAAAVVLDEAAATALRDELSAWLATPKIHPVVTDDESPNPETGADNDI